MDSRHRFYSQERIVIPYASDNDSGSVDLQLSNLDNIQTDRSNVEITELDISNLPKPQRSIENIAYLKRPYSVSSSICESLIQAIQDVFSIEPKTETDKLTFLRALSTLSQTLPYDDTTQVFIHSHVDNIVRILTMLAEEDPLQLFFSPVGHEVFVTISELSYHDVPLFSSEEHTGFFSLIIKNIITLPMLETLMEQWQTTANESYDFERHYKQTLQSFTEMLQSLVVKDPHLEKFDLIYKHLDPWLQSTTDHERQRALANLVHVLQCLSRHLSLQLPLKFDKLGHLVAMVAMLCGDPVKEVSDDATEGMHALLHITLKLKYTTHEKKNQQTLRKAMKKCHDLLELYTIKHFCSSPFKIAQVFEIFLNSKELCQFVLTILNGLKYLQHPNTQQSAGRLLVSLVKNAASRFEKLPDILGVICAQFSIITHPVVRHQIIQTVSLFIAKPKYTDVVISRLLYYPVPYDRHLAELWRTLEVELPNTTWILWRLLRKLQKFHDISSQDKMAYEAVAATDALYEVFVGNKLRAATYRLFPQLLMALLVQIHHSIGLTMSDVAIPSGLYTEQDISSEVTPLCFAIQATKTLLLRTWCWQEFNIMEKNKGWTLLEERDFHLQGVSLLANALLQRNHCLAHKVMYLLVPLLNRGNDRHKLTSAGFFVELLQCPLARRLPTIYSFTRLKDWLHHENDVFKTIALKGLQYLFRYPDLLGKSDPHYGHNLDDIHREDIKSLLPGILALLGEPDEKVVLLAIQVLLQLVRMMDFSTLAAMMRTLLDSLFGDMRPDIHLFSMTLFGASVKFVKYTDKKNVENQVLDSLVPLLLYSQDDNNAIAEESRNVLSICAQFLKWKLPNDVYCKDPWYIKPSTVERICEFFGNKCKGKVNILEQTLMFSKNERLPIRRTAVLFVGLFSKYMDHAELKMKGIDWIENDLRVLLHDPEPSLRIIASQALFRVRTAGSDPQPAQTERNLP